ncbi:MAG: glycine cleavage system protein GcvH [Candidatus Omnitrophica bacterium]|nr:glycine cleavage system protein GcvH [Candidatus Omnitrophota bacterium]
MNVPEGLFYTKEHEWVKIDGNLAKMGISDHAQHELGDITFVELPALHVQCKQFKQIAIIESVKAASDVYAPLSGKISAVNKQVVANPELVNQSPYDQGWLLVIELTEESQLANLMDAETYKNYLKENL